MGIEKVLKKIVIEQNRRHLGYPAASLVDDIVHALLNSEEVEVRLKGPVRYGCHCDLLPYQPPSVCVIDADERFNCTHAERGIKKEDCEYWKPWGCDLRFLDVHRERGAQITALCESLSTLLEAVYPVIDRLPAGGDGINITGIEKDIRKLNEAVRKIKGER